MRGKNVSTAALSMGIHKVMSVECETIHVRRRDFFWTFVYIKNTGNWVAGKVVTLSTGAPRAGTINTPPGCFRNNLLRYNVDNDNVMNS